MKRLITLFLLAMMWVLPLTGQDLYFSQFHNSPFLLNPALAGVFDGDFRFTANYRNQWSSVPVNYNTFTGSFDFRAIGNKPRKGFFSGGMIFHFDQAGDLALYHLNIHGGVAYTQRLGRNFYGSLGGSFGFVNQGLDQNRITLDEHYNPETGFPSGSGPGSEDFTYLNRTYPDVGAGINIRYQRLSNYELINRLEQRTKIDFGVGLFHLNQPKRGWLDSVDVTHDIRISPYVMYTQQIGPNWDLIGNVRGQFQGPHDEWMAIVGPKYHISRELGKQLALKLQCGFRINQELETIFPGIEVFYNNFHFGFGYDVNLSDFNVATNGKGGPLFYLSYVIKRVHPISVHKTCPVI